MRPSDLARHVRSRLEALSVPLSVEDETVAGLGRDAHAAWTAFKAQAELPLDQPEMLVDGEARFVRTGSDDDLVRFETAVWDNVAAAPTESPVFELTFTRQITLRDAPDATRPPWSTRELQLTVEVPLDSELRTLGGVLLWGRGGPPMASPREAENAEFGEAWAGPASRWSERVEQTAAFKAALLDREPLSFQLTTAYA